jgi:predicted P-loop ATPase
VTDPIDLDRERKKRAAKPKPKPFEGWEAALHVDGYGRVKRSLANVMTILTDHPTWCNVIAYDAFADVIVSRTAPPTRKQDAPTNHRAGEWSDADSVRTAAWIAEAYQIDVGVQIVEQAVAAVARKSLVHPVRDYLKALKWDATQRLPTMLPHYFGAEQNGYTGAIGVKWMISAVARIMSPGCKSDHLLILESPEQGTGKSTALNILAGEYFADTGIVLGDKDSYQNLRRVWIYEFGELSAIRSAKDVERVKGFVTSRSDHYRPSYGRRALDFPRQCVFAGSTNETTYLADRTGNRRFWPVKTGRIDLAGLALDRDQLWAEAVTRYSSNEPWHVDSLELVNQCREQQEEREHLDPWVQFVTEWLTDPTVPDENLGGTARSRVNVENGITTADVLVGAIAMKRDRIDRAAETRAGQVLTHLGWERRKVRDPADWKKRTWRYFEPTKNVPTVPTVSHSNDEGGDVR